MPLAQKTAEMRQRMSPAEQAAFEEAFDDSSEFYTELILKL